MRNDLRTKNQSDLTRLSVSGIDTCGRGSTRIDARTYPPGIPITRKIRKIRKGGVVQPVSEKDERRWPDDG